MINEIINNVLIDAFVLVNCLKRFLTSKKDDDRYDRVSSRITTFLLIIISIVMIIAQFLIKPVICWCPTHFTKAQVKYANRFCWVKNTYYLPFNEKIPKKQDAHDYLQYYQFTIFIIIGQAILYYIPSLIWHRMNTKSGIDSDDILHKAEELSHCPISKITSDTRDAKLNYIANQFRYLNHSKDYDREYKTSGLKRLCFGFLHIAEGSFNCYLVLVFLLTKLLYILNAIGQFWLLNKILFNKFNIYGFETLGNVVADHNWQNSPMVAFPRVTMCDLETRRLGNIHRYTLQCTLPLNFLNEKIFMFLWFWMAIVAAVTVFGFLQWIIRTLWPGDDYRFISNHLFLEAEEKSSKVKRFINKYLRSDGVFLLRLISHNTTTLTTNEITRALWDQWEQEVGS